MTRDELAQALDRVMAQYPELSNHGMCLIGPADLEAEREKLRASLSEIRATIEILRRDYVPLALDKSKKRAPGSYGLKHVVEQMTGYISNGVMIAAACIAGFQIQTYASSPNVLIGCQLRGCEGTK